jgi:hypothetical protein
MFSGKGKMVSVTNLALRQEIHMGECRYYFSYCMTLRKHEDCDNLRMKHYNELSEELALEEAMDMS